MKLVASLEQNYFVSFPAQYFNMLHNFQPKSHGTYHVWKKRFPWILREAG